MHINIYLTMNIMYYYIYDNNTVGLVEIVFLQQILNSFQDIYIEFYQRMPQTRNVLWGQFIQMNNSCPQRRPTINSCSIDKEKDRDIRIYHYHSPAVIQFHVVGAKVENCLKKCIRIATFIELSRNQEQTFPGSVVK